MLAQRIESLSSLRAHRTCGDTRRAVVLLGFAVQTHAQDIALAVPDYHWWYGCTPTSVGMIMGWYDRVGSGGIDYRRLDYSSLIPGGVALAARKTTIATGGTQPERVRFENVRGTWSWVADQRGRLRLDACLPVRLCERAAAAGVAGTIARPRGSGARLHRSRQRIRGRRGRCHHVPGGGCGPLGAVVGGRGARRG